MSFKSVSFDDNKELLNDVQENIEEEKIEIQLAEQLAVQAAKGRDTAIKFLAESFNHIHNLI